MRIGFDAKRAFFNSTGLGNYSREVIAAMMELHRDENYFLYSSKKPRKNSPQFLPQDSDARLITAGVRLPAVWRSWGMTADWRRNELDLYHGLSNEIPFSSHRTDRVKRIVTIHDLIFLRYPKYYPRFDRRMYRFKSHYACRYAHKLICVSEQTARDVQEFYHTETERIEIIPPIINEIFYRKSSGDEISKLKNKFSLPERFWVSVGTIEERKNLISAVKALLLLPEKDRLPIVVVGHKARHWQKVEALLKKKNLHHLILHLPQISSADLPALYKSSIAALYPSLYEGFGIPVAEALASGTPVIASASSSVPEAAGGGGLLVNPNKADEIADAMSQLLSSETKRNELIATGKKHVQQFRRGVVAEKIRQVYTATVGK